MRKRPRGPRLRIGFHPHLEHYTVGLTSALSRKFDLTLVAPRRYSVNIPHAPIPPIYGLRRVLMIGMLALGRFDVVHANNAVVGRWLLRSRGVLVVTEHGHMHPEVLASEPGLRRELDRLRKLYEAGVPVITISEYSRRLLMEHGIRVAKVVHHGVLPMFRSRKPRPPPRGKLRVLMVSRMVRLKNPLLAVEALARLHAEAELVIRGEGPLLGRLLSTARRLRIRVETIPRLRFEEMPRVYSMGDVYVHTNDKEPFGLTVLEAMASGLPVVVPRAGGAFEVAGRAAVAYEPGDPGDLAGVVEALASDPAFYERMSRESLERSSEFSWEKAAEKVSEVYMFALNKL